MISSIIKIFFSWCSKTYFATINMTVHIFLIILVQFMTDRKCLLFQVLDSVLHRHSFLVTFSVTCLPTLAVYFVHKVIIPDEVISNSAVASG